jgi:hypothetical protein
MDRIVVIPGKRFRPLADLLILMMIVTNRRNSTAIVESVALAVEPDPRRGNVTLMQQPFRRFFVFVEEQVVEHQAIRLLPLAPQHDQHDHFECIER